jgi:hypothetical protein
MSEPESKPPEVLTDAPQQFERIKVVADTQVAENREPDPLALVGEEDLARQRVIVQIDHLRTEVGQIKQLHWVRIGLIGALFFLVVVWLFVLLLILSFQGFVLGAFHLSDKILIAYITSTTVSVLGLFHIAAKWLFSGDYRAFSRTLLAASEKQKLLEEKELHKK